MTHADYPNLFTEARIKNLVMKNRIVKPSMCDNMSDREGGVTDQKVAYFRRAAQGGVGWINLGYAYVTRRGRGCTYFQVGIYDDDLIPGLRRLTDTVHEYDVRMGCQIAHAGRQTTHHYIDGAAPEAPSAVAEHTLGEVPEEMSLERIHEVQQDFAQAAVRAREAGFDLVELHGAHGYLFHSFISPLGNHRSDEYGGTLENRMRFSLETVREVRKAIGDDFPLGYRISGDEFMDGGFTLDDTLEVVAALEREGVDYVHISAGSYDSFQLMIAPMGIGPGQLEHLATAVKQRVSIPVLSVGRYDTPGLADRVIADGHADFISMGRALLADPDLPHKAFAGRPDDIQPCIACLQGCIDRWVAALDITCLVNPEAGREILPGWQTPSSTAAGERKRVLVIGAGPAGLEAARTAARGGHSVTVWESEGEVGGNMALAGKPAKSREWGSLVAWYTSQLQELDVEVQTGRRATADDVLVWKPDAVIVATGARPLIPRQIPGWDLTHVLSPSQALREKPRGGMRVIVEGGDLIGCQVALWFAEHNNQVTLLARGRTDLFGEGDDEFAYDMVGEIRRPTIIEELKASVQLVPKRGIKRIVSDGMYGLLVVIDTAGAFPPHTATLRIGPVDEETMPADIVVIGTKRRPVDELYDLLRGSVPELYIVGDAIEPRTVEEAIAEGSAAARSVGAMAAVTPTMEAEPSLAG
jgi:2,4-dienoyl-CoA reductase-like NADH-dependent reductase (Old Yellow Enzyme family)/NADPH-dependent 2,4-dienoyl-CoA reductase/sulfur reductase-like enzyme